MANRIKREPRTWMHEGRLTTFVPLPCGALAKMDAADFESLLARGVSSQWSLSTGAHGGANVKANLKGGKKVSVAFELLSPGRSQQVTYRNGNRLDLRRSNLEVEPRRGRRAAFDGPVLPYVPKNDRTGEVAHGLQERSGDSQAPSPVAQYVRFPLAPAKAPAPLATEGAE